ncbi:hypothetical protein APZ42_013081 [Daphnia magna]|uniref:Uncharacterized protein n=1 Tax=Daphnia magna TaxID=35525 RepID=A0A162R6L5_9CRUS|nr:hypothetical protein APZ42_013081 [Daphnia magna]
MRTQIIISRRSAIFVLMLSVIKMDNYDFDVYQWKTKCVVGFTALLFAVTLLKKKYLIRKRHPIGRPWERSFNKEENETKKTW